jgi:hypothetical protein
MSTETDIFDATRDAIESSQCAIRIGRDMISKATCPGIDRIRQNTEQGQMLGVSVPARYKLEDEPANANITEGKIIEVQMTGQTEWVKLRVLARHVLGGLVRITLEHPYE